MNTKDATIKTKGFGFVSGVQTDFSCMAGKKTMGTLILTGMSSDDDGQVIINSESLNAPDQPTLNIDYVYDQISAPEELIIKVNFSDNFPETAQFQIKSSQFPGYNVEKQPVENKELNASTKQPFNTELRLSFWFDDNMPETLSAELAFFKVVKGDGIIEKQVKIADTMLKLNTSF